MFSSDNKQKTLMEKSTQQNLIARDTTIVGDIVSQGPFRIDGNIDGNLKTESKIVIGKTGVLKGALQGVNVDIEGHFSGKLIITGTLSLKSTAHIEGEVQVNKLAIEPGATFNASCSMKAVKELNSTSKQRQKIRHKTEKTA